MSRETDLASSERLEHVAELCEDALLNTIYKNTHVKPAVDQLIKQRKVVKARTGRAYTEQTPRTANPQLF